MVAVVTRRAYTRYTRGRRVSGIRSRRRRLELHQKFLIRPRNRADDEYIFVSPMYTIAFSRDAYVCYNIVWCLIYVDVDGRKFNIPTRNEPYGHTRDKSKLVFCHVFILDSEEEEIVYFTVETKPLWPYLIGCIIY